MFRTQLSVCLELLSGRNRLNKLKNCRKPEDGIAGIPAVFYFVKKRIRTVLIRSDPDIRPLSECFAVFCGFAAILFLKFFVEMRQIRITRSFCDNRNRNICRP